MKKLSFILAAFLVCGAMQAQISFDFEDGTLQGWTTIDADGTPMGWCCRIPWILFQATL